MEEHKVVIIGGGFAGVKCALELQKKGLENVKITLVSDRPHFEYHGALYRLVAGHSPLEVCIPIREIIDEEEVEFVVDKISKIDPNYKEIFSESGSKYKYDTLVLALGAETNYFGITGLKEFSFGMKTIKDALELKRHIHEVIESCVNGTKADNLCAGNFVVVGGGATGVELASELIVYARKLAKIHGIEPSLMNVELIEAAPRILPTMDEKFASKVEKKMRSLGVNIRTNREVLGEDIENVYLRDMQLKTKTVIWTAGVKANRLIRDAGFTVDPRGRAEVGPELRTPDYPDVFISGDAAATPRSGMAQTALYDGEYIANTIAAEFEKEAKKPYIPGKPIYAIPVGPGWAGTVAGPITVYGKIGWFLRRVVDLVVFRALLPKRAAHEVFGSHTQTCEACPVCCEYESEFGTKE